MPVAPVSLYVIKSWSGDTLALTPQKPSKSREPLTFASIDDASWFIQRLSLKASPKLLVNLHNRMPDIPWVG